MSRTALWLGALLLAGAYAMLWPGLTEPMLSLSGTVEKEKLVEIGREILRESSTSGLVKGLAERMIAGLDVSGTVSAFEKTDSILGTARTLAEGGNRFVAVLILTFSVAVPLVKGLLVLATLLPLSGRARRGLLSVASASGKWSMADVFVIAIFIAFLGGNGLSDGRGLVDVEASLGPGFSWFLGYCLLSIAATQLIAWGARRGDAPSPAPTSKASAKPAARRAPAPGTSTKTAGRARRSAR